MSSTRYIKLVTVVTFLSWAMTAKATLSSSISGCVYVDNNNNGVFDSGDGVLPGVQVTLTGTDILGRAVGMTTSTLTNGSYFIGNLVPSSGFGYTLLEGPAPGYLERTDNVGSPFGGTWIPATDAISHIVVPLGPAVAATDYNFGELPEPTTIIAGALLFLPFGASTLSMLRNRKAG